MLNWRLPVAGLVAHATTMRRAATRSKRVNLMGYRGGPSGPPTRRSLHANRQNSERIQLAANSLHNLLRRRPQRRTRQPASKAKQIQCRLESRNSKASANRPRDRRHRPLECASLADPVFLDELDQVDALIRQQRRQREYRAICPRTQRLKERRRGAREEREIVRRPVDA